ncbi:hypothetical protein C1C98_21830 [Pseudomonas ogarae]|uniref:Uncharacterized protein n=1 Tax=Pseudomonas ogarae (strain DSM 112162 / CECT 30235 / F113) TaxID=1114970 RepID=A0ABN5GBQ7_PSEO1|nr:hypothetical protein C1C98_21830 [Pseudomonas ogarae]
MRHRQVPLYKPASQISQPTDNLWRGSLLPLGCAAAPFVSAAHSSGSKLPRHRCIIYQNYSTTPL